MKPHGLSDEAVFRLELDVRRLNRENQELRRQLGVKLNGLSVPVPVDTAVDNSVDKSTPVDTAVDMESGTRPATLDRKAYQREWAAKNRAALKSKQLTP